MSEQFFAVNRDFSVTIGVLAGYPQPAFLSHDYVCPETSLRRQDSPRMRLAIHFFSRSNCPANSFKAWGLLIRSTNTLWIKSNSCSEVTKPRIFATAAKSFRITSRRLPGTFHFMTVV